MSNRAFKPWALSPRLPKSCEQNAAYISDLLYL